MAKLIDLTGQRFGRLTVISRSENLKDSHAKWLCECDCGQQTAVLGKSLRKGLTKSCGCIQKEILSTNRKTHGDSGTKLYKIWASMKQRTVNMNSKAYKNYGERGITVCDEWLNSFESFKAWAIESGYAENLSIDRIDNEKGYFPENCRWTDLNTQANNKRTNHYVTYQEETKTIADWARETGIPHRLLQSRIERLGWSVEKALTTPIKKKK